MSKRLPLHMIPSALFEVDEIPRTLTGKVDRKLLRQTAATFTLRDLNQKPTLDETARPMTENEKKLRQLWAEMLRLDQPAIRVVDNFFRLGGNSVAMKVASQARRLAMNITVVDIFRFPRLCDLAAAAKPLILQDDSTILPFSLLDTSKPAEQLRREIAAVHRLEQDDIEDLLPCTPLQEGLLSLTGLDGDYMMQRVLRVADDVETSRLRAAWELVAEKLPIMRTRFFLTQGHQILQGVLKEKLRWLQAGHLDEYLRSDAPVRGIDSIVGPCINLVPAQLCISQPWNVLSLLERLRTQFTSLHQRDTRGVDEIHEQCTDWPTTDTFDLIFFHQNVDESYEHRLAGAPRKVDLYLNPAAPVRRTCVISYQEDRTLKVKLLTTSHLMTDEGSMALLDAFVDAFTVLCANRYKLAPLSKPALDT